MAGTSRLRLYSARIGLALVATGLTLVLGEGVARIAAPRQTFRPGIKAFREKALVQDKALGWRVKPGADVTVNGIRYSFSPLATRGSVESIDKPVVIAGDSVTMGWGVPEETAYPARLEKLLNRPIVNGGVIGYGIDQDLTRLQELVEQTRARAAILGYFPNDPEGQESMPEDSNESSSMLWALLSPAFQRLMGHGTPSMTEHHRALHVPGSVPYSRVIAGFFKLNRFCQEKHLACGVVLLPELTTRPYPLADVHERLTELAKVQGLHVLDLAPSITDVDPRTLWVAPDDPHPNAEGHRRYAEAMAPWLQSWLP